MRPPNHTSDYLIFQGLFDGLDDAVIAHDADLNIVRCNQSAGLLLEVDPLSLIGKNFRELFPENWHSRITDIIKNVGQGRVPAIFKFEFIGGGAGHQIVGSKILPFYEHADLAGFIHIIRPDTFNAAYEEQQSILSAIIENSDDAIISKTLEGYITSWNKGAERLFGYSAAEVTGKHITLLIPEERLYEEDEILGHIGKGERIQHYNTYRLKKDGTQVPISLTASPIKDKGGNIIGVSKIARDVSIEQLIVEKQELLAAIIESSDDAIISKTLDGIITTWNEGAEKIFGYSEAEVIGKSIAILIPQYRLYEERKIIESIRKGEKIDHFQTTRLHKNGWELNISLTVSPVKNADGVIIGASKVARDITVQKRAEEAIRLNAEKLEILNSVGRTISENLDIQSILQKVTDATTAITNAAFGTFFYNMIDKKNESCTHYTIAGVPTSAFQHFQAPDNINEFGTTFRSGGIIRVDDITKDPGHGESAPYFGIPEGVDVVSYLAVPVISNSGDIIGGLFFGHPQAGMFTAEHEDLVSNLAAQAAVALDNSKLYQEVKELNNKKDEFIALASHELKTPLTSMSGFLQLLRKRVTDEANNGFIDRVMAQLGKLNTLINDLLDISRMESGKMQYNFSTFDFKAFLLESVENHKEFNTAHTIIAEAADEIFIQADQLRLEQVLSNLITNAIKYSPAGGLVQIKCIADEHNLILSVKDTGVGINTEHIEQIFDQFYRINDQSRNISGLGLGLYISKEIITRHGGTIWAESEPGGGSIFTFKIPLFQSS